LEPSASYLQTAIDMYEKGDLVIEIDSVYKFDGGVIDAFERLDTGRARGKVVIEM